MFRFKEIREIKDEKIRTKKEEKKEFLKIKPETGITVEESQAFWDSIFSGGE